MKNIVWLASYPKSGNTWLRSIITYALHGKVEINQLGSIIPSLPLVTMAISGMTSTKSHESVALAWQNVQKKISQDAGHSRVILKTHNACGLINGRPFPSNEFSAGCIYMVRDPRDVLVSWAKHGDKTLEQAEREMCDEQFSTMEKNRSYSREFLSSWPNHVNGWTKSNTNKLVIRYEDMLHHPISQTQKILQFLSIESRYSIDEIVFATSFKELKNQEMQNGFIERKGTESFFRKGAARAWKDVKYDFSRVTSSFATTMTKFGYELNC